MTYYRRDERKMVRKGDVFGKDVRTDVVRHGRLWSEMTMEEIKG